MDKIALISVIISLVVAIAAAGVYFYVSKDKDFLEEMSFEEKKEFLEKKADGKSIGIPQSIHQK